MLLPYARYKTDLDLTNLPTEGRMLISDRNSIWTYDLGRHSKDFPSFNRDEVERLKREQCIFGTEAFVLKTLREETLERAGFAAKHFSDLIARIKATTEAKVLRTTNRGERYFLLP